MDSEDKNAGFYNLTGANGNILNSLVFVIVHNNAQCSKKQCRCYMTPPLILLQNTPRVWSVIQDKSQWSTGEDGFVIPSWFLWWKGNFFTMTVVQSAAISCHSWRGYQLKIGNRKNNGKSKGGFTCFTCFPFVPPLLPPLPFLPPLVWTTFHRHCSPATLTSAGVQRLHLITGSPLTRGGGLLLMSDLKWGRSQGANISRAFLLIIVQRKPSSQSSSRVWSNTNICRRTKETLLWAPV